MAVVDLPRRDRVERWRQAMSETFVPLDVSCLESAGFSGSLGSKHIGELLVTSLSSSPQHISRNRTKMSSTDPELWQIALARRGGVRLDQDDRQVSLGPGDLVVYETTRPFRWSFDGPWTATVFTLPRAAVALTETESRALTARLLPGGAGAGGLVSRLLADLADHAEELAPVAPDRMVDDLTDLVITLLRDCVSDPGARLTTRQAALLRVKDYIGAHLADPDLTPGRIAAAHHMSLRALHALFAEEPDSVAAHIRGRRLHRCARDLHDPRLAGIPITALAAGHGFGDTRGFERAFRAVYGMTPGQYRAGRPE